MKIKIELDTRYFVNADELEQALKRVGVLITNGIYEQENNPNPIIENNHIIGHCHIEAS